MFDFDSISTSCTFFHLNLGAAVRREWKIIWRRAEPVENSKSLMNEETNKEKGENYLKRKKNVVGRGVPAAGPHSGQPWKGEQAPEGHRRIAAPHQESPEGEERCWGLAQAFAEQDQDDLLIQEPG